MALKALRGAGFAVGLAALLLFSISVALTVGWLIGWSVGDVARLIMSGSFGPAALAHDFLHMVQAQVSQAHTLLSTALRHL